MKYLRFIFCCAVAAFLVACGGGGGDAGTTPGGGGATPKVQDFIFSFDKNVLTNGGGDVSKLTVTTLDASNNPVAEVPVLVSVDSGVFTPDNTKTDAKGVFTGNLTIGANKTDREISVSVQVNGIKKTTKMPVQGSQLSVMISPTSMNVGQQVMLSVAVKDHAGSGIQGVPVVIAGFPGFDGTYQSDVNGLITKNGVAPASGTYAVTATSSGVTTFTSVSVGTVVVVPEVAPSVEITAKSLTANPGVIAPNAEGGATNRTQLIAKFLTNGNTAVKNMRVRFYIYKEALGSGEYISTGDNLVHSGSDGSAESYYVAGTRSSATDGVSVIACFSKKDFPAKAPGVELVPGGVNCPDYVDTKITVAAQPLGLTIGTSNKIRKGTNETMYIKDFTVQVVDASGRPVKDVTVTPQVDVTHYGKGIVRTVGRPPNGLPFLGAVNWPTLIPDERWVYADNCEGKSGAVYCYDIQPEFRLDQDYQYAGHLSVWCVNEDANRNGFLNASEDVNGDGRLQPGTPIGVSMAGGVSSVKTDENGRATFEVSYLQRYANWLSYTLTVTAKVVGSEGRARTTYITQGAEEDKNNGEFLTPPFGRGACNSPD